MGPMKQKANKKCARIFLITAGVCLYHLIGAGVSLLHLVPPTDNAIFPTNKRKGPKKQTWIAEYCLDKNKNSVLQNRSDFAVELLAEQKSNFIYKYPGANKTEES